MILCGKHKEYGIHEFPAQLSSGIPKKEQLFICLFTPQTEVPLPHTKSAEFLDFHENLWRSWFYGKAWISRKITRKQPFVPEAENDNETYAFLHGWEAVRVLLGPEWWNSLNSTNFSRIPLILVKSGGNQWFQGFRERKWCLYTEPYYTKRILGILRCFSRPYH